MTSEATKAAFPKGTKVKFSDEFTATVIGYKETRYNGTQLVVRVDDPEFNEGTGRSNKRYMYPSLTRKVEE